MRSRNPSLAVVARLSLLPLLSGAALLAPLASLELLAERPAAADTLSGTKASLMFDHAHAIELRFDRGHATLVVRRTFENRSTLFDQAFLHVTDLPEGAVATGLRTLGGTAKEPIWYGAELLDAELAAKRYRELTGMGGWYPKDPALLSWREQGHLLLQVFPVAPRADKTVEFTLTVPTKWIDGRHVLELPPMGTEALPPSLTLRPAHDGDALFVDGVAVASGDARKLLAKLSLSLSQPDAPKLGGSFASVTFAKGRALLHASIEARKPLSETPKGAYVIVVLDGSRSIDEGQHDAHLAAARAYLGHLPDAKAQVLVFDRTTRALETGFVPAVTAIADLKAPKWTPKNGSDLDVALADAAKRIGDAPAGAPRRILVLTDLATRSTLLPERIQGLDATKAIVHVATVANGAASLERDDASPWAVVPRATGGLLWRAQARSLDTGAAEPAFEEWARPLRIDRLAIAGIALDPSVNLPYSIAEGDGFEELRFASFGTPALEVRGELWSTPIATVLSSTTEGEKRWAALAIGSPLLHQLTDAEITTLAFKGGAVSPTTSYLAIEPGVRPSTEGLDQAGDGEGGGGLGDGVGVGTLGGYGHGINEPDPMKHLRGELARVVAACGGGEVFVRLETTRSEIVAVDVVPKVASEPLKTCVREGAFGLELPNWFHAPFATWSVDVPKK
jgi:hypothetical protein